MSKSEELQRRDKDTKVIMLSTIQNFLEDNVYEDKILKAFEWLENYLRDLECEIELNKTLVIIEKTHNEYEK